MNNITFGYYVGNSIKEIMKNMEDLYPPFGIWIPVDDRLPTTKGLYMVSIDPLYLPPSDVALVDIWGWDGENWLVDNFVDGYDVVDQDEYPVIAWMPLPKPYLIWDEESQRCVKPI